MRKGERSLRWISWASKATLFGGPTIDSTRSSWLNGTPFRPTIRRLGVHQIESTSQDRRSSFSPLVSPIRQGPHCILEHPGWNFFHTQFHEQFRCFHRRFFTAETKLDRQVWRNSSRTEQWEALFFPAQQITARSLACKLPHAADNPYALGYADGAPGIEKIKCVGAFQTIIVSRQNQILFKKPRAFVLVHGKQLEQHLNVSHLEIVRRKLDLFTMANIAICYIIRRASRICLSTSAMKAPIRSNP